MQAGCHRNGNKYISDEKTHSLPDFQAPLQTMGMLIILSLQLHLGFGTLHILVHGETSLFLYLPSFEAGSIFYYNIRSCETIAKQCSRISSQYKSVTFFLLVSIYYRSLYNHSICLVGHRHECLTCATVSTKCKGKCCLDTSVWQGWT